MTYRFLPFTPPKNLDEFAVMAEAIMEAVLKNKDGARERPGDQSEIDAVNGMNAMIQPALSWLNDHITDDGDPSPILRSFGERPTDEALERLMTSIGVIDMASDHSRGIEDAHWGARALASLGLPLDTKHGVVFAEDGRRRLIFEKSPEVEAMLGQLSPEDASVTSMTRDEVSELNVTGLVPGSVMSRVPPPDAPSSSEPPVGIDPRLRDIPTGPSVLH